MNPPDMVEQEQQMKQGAAKLLMLSNSSSAESSEEDEEEEEEEEEGGIGNGISIKEEDDEYADEEDEGESSLASSYNYRRNATTTAMPRPQSRTTTYQLGAQTQKPLEVASQSDLNHRQLSQPQQKQKDYEDVKQVELFGVSIVALTINGKERLCLAQISNTLLKEFSYNEIHNRRVALGITCVQCTPIQLEMLRRAGAMPSSSRRCGMITMREAERLCRSFLVEEQPPELPENFYFTVAHRVNYGCKGRFVPARYISSRAKCIECFYCGEFYSPNKFIFHSHRQPHITDCNPPDSPNINSWRKHIDLDWGQEHSQEIKYAWEDVKSLFNGGTRRRAPQGPPVAASGSATTTSRDAGSAGIKHHVGGLHHHHHHNHHHHLTSSPAAGQANQRGPKAADEDQLIIDVDDSTHGNKMYVKPNTSASQTKRSGEAAVSKAWLSSGSQHQLSGRSGGSKRQPGNSLMLTTQSNPNRSSLFTATNDMRNCMSPMKRAFNSISPQHQQQQQQAPCNNKRFSGGACNIIQQGSNEQQLLGSSDIKHSSVGGCAQDRSFSQAPASPRPLQATVGRVAPTAQQQSLSFVDFMSSPAPSGGRCPISNESANINNNQSNQQATNKPIGLSYQNSPSFIYSQLYSQLMQHQPALQQQTGQQQQQQQQLTTAMDAQLALRHHLWSSLLANLQCNTGNQTYSLQQQQQSQLNNLGLCNQSIADKPDLPSTGISHLLSGQLYQPQLNSNPIGPKLTRNNQTPHEHGYKTTQNSPFSMHKSFQAETSDL